MQTGLPCQHLVETINDGEQSIRAMDRAPAHAADTDKPGALDHMRERHCTAFIITGMTSLNDWHEGRIDPGIFSAQPAFDVGPDGKIGRAHVCTPVTNAHIVFRLMLEKK